MKKVISVLLALVMTFTVALSCAVPAFAEENYTWEDITRVAILSSLSNNFAKTFAQMVNYDEQTKYALRDKLFTSFSNNFTDSLLSEDVTEDQIRSFLTDSLQPVVNELFGDGMWPFVSNTVLSTALEVFNTIDIASMKNFDVSMIDDQIAQKAVVYLGNYLRGQGTDEGSIGFVTSYIGSIVSTYVVNYKAQILNSIYNILYSQVSRNEKESLIADKIADILEEILADYPFLSIDINDVSQNIATQLCDGEFGSFLTATTLSDIDIAFILIAALEAVAIIVCIVIIAKKNKQIKAAK